MRDNGLHVIVGQRPKGPHYTQALKDGWESGSTLFSVDEAAEREGQ